MDSTPFLSQSKSACPCKATTLRGVVFVLLLVIVVLVCVLLERIYHHPYGLGGGQEAHEHDDERRRYHMDIVERVNGEQDLWKARYNRYAESMEDRQKGLAELYPLMEDEAKEMAATHGKEWSGLHESIVNYFGNSGNNAQYIRSLLERADREPPPARFDSRERWPLCASVGSLRNQGACGTCWAAAIASVISDRICIASNGTMQPTVSMQDMLACCAICGSCWGSVYSVVPLIQWVDRGFVTGGDYGSREGCMPYMVDSECGRPCPVSSYGPSEGKKVKPDCTRTCQPLYDWTYEQDAHFGRSVRWLNVNSALGVLATAAAGRFAAANKTNLYFPNVYRELDGMDAQALSRLPAGADYIRRTESVWRQRNAVLKMEIMTNGPVVACFDVYEDFEHYDGGMYEHVAGNYSYGHCVRLLGWGETAGGRQYWTLANSWGADWGEAGFFRMLNEYADGRKTDLLDDISAGLPDIERTERHQAAHGRVL